METCARGFSYMPEKLEVNLQYIEDGELDRVWKASRRQRAKDQEQRIWEDFVKEKDIVHNACTEDPYQFLHELPEHCLKELMEAELHKMRAETEEPLVEQPNQVEGENPYETQASHNVTFVEDDKLGSNNDMFHIFDDDNDFNQSDVEGDDDQPESPSTVRERASVELLPEDNTPDVAAVKSTETVSNFIESSIHCARVKDIRIKIGQEMSHMMASLEVQNVMSLDRSEVSRRCRRAAEFCARFNRIYMYQLQRQAHNIKRHVAQSLPLAQHTQFQSQMLRVVSLHQNMLQAFQVFHKSFPATMCLRECGRALRHACSFVRDASALCRAVPPPDRFPAAHDLYDDELLQTCDKLDDAVNEYDLRVADILSSSDLPTVPVSATPSSTLSSKSGKNKLKKNPFCKTGSKSLSIKGADGRLSMYSLDTLRINLHPKSTGSRDHSGGVGRGRASPSVVSATKRQQAVKGQDINTKKLAHRPLMRAPNSGHARPRHAKDIEIATMVEAVETCLSSQVGSQCGSPRSPARPSPRQNPHAPRKPSPHRRLSPNRRTHVPSPRTKTRRVATSPKQPQNKKSLSSIKSETATATVKTQIAPVTQIQCAQRLPEGGRNTDRPQIEKLGHTGNITDRSTHSEKIGYTDRYSDRSERSRNSERCSIAKNAERLTHTDRSRRSEKKESPNDGKGKGDRVVKDTVVGKRKQLDGSDADKEFCGVKELTDNKDDYSRSYAKEVEEERSERSRAGSITSRCDVSWLLRQLCSGDPSGLTEERVSGAKNAQLLCIRGVTSPRQPSTPQLLRILEETIQKQTPKPMYDAQKPKNPERFRLNFNIGETTANRLFQYRTKFVQHMLTSPLYANSAVGKPWEMIGSVSNKIIDDLLTCVAKEMEIKEVLRDMYRCETN